MVFHVNDGFEGLGFYFLKMNRSFRAEESALRQRQQQQMGSLRSSGMKEKDEELTLFLEMRRREKERSDLLLQNSDEFDAPLGNKFFFSCFHRYFF